MQKKESVTDNKKEREWKKRQDHEDHEVSRQTLGVRAKAETAMPSRAYNRSDAHACFMLNWMHMRLTLPLQLAYA